jgi:hypothetical protein
MMKVKNTTFNQCFGSRSDGSVINWPSGTEYAILNYRSGSLLFYRRLKELSENSSKFEKI